MRAYRFVHNGSKKAALHYTRMVCAEAAIEKLQLHIQRDAKTEPQRFCLFRSDGNSPSDGHLTLSFLLCNMSSPQWDKTSLKSELECCLIKDIVKLVLERLLHRKSFLNINVIDLVILHTNNSVADALLKELNSVVTHLCCNDSVSYCW